MSKEILSDYSNKTTYDSWSIFQLCFNICLDIILIICFPKIIKEYPITTILFFSTLVILYKYHYKSINSFFKNESKLEELNLISSSFFFLFGIVFLGICEYPILTIIAISIFSSIIYLFSKWAFHDYPDWSEERQAEEHNIRKIYSLSENSVIHNLAVGLDMGFWGESIDQNRKELYGAKFCRYWGNIATILRAYLRVNNKGLDAREYSKEELEQFLLEFIKEKDLTEYDYEVWRANKLNQIYDENQEKFDKHPKLWNKVLEKYKETEIKQYVPKKGDEVKFRLFLNNLPKV